MKLNQSEINGRISLLMQRLGNNQLQFARLLGVTQPAVSKYLNGRIPPPAVLFKLARASGTTIEWILCGRHDLAEDRVAENGTSYSLRLSADDKIGRLPTALQKRIIALLDTLLETLPDQARTGKQNS
jgi:transcriptional regulator with XRE-family HTH domain